MGKFSDSAPTPATPLCPLGRLLIDPSLDAADVAALTGALVDPTVTNAAIRRWLGDNDVRFNKDTVAAHRAGTCRCPAA